MSTKGNDGSFGLDRVAIEKIDWELALKRVLQDTRSDFIWAPHIQFIYKYAGKNIIDDIKLELSSGNFNSGIPLTIEVPKSFRIMVGSVSQRLGPSFSRPGSILMPKDRVLYQVIADQAAPIISRITDSKKSFSHILSDDVNDNMFLSTRICWNKLQEKLKEYAKINKFKYVIKLDVSDYFGSINQHNLINTLKGYGFEPPFADRLEKMLLSYTGQRSSRGIIQGVCPSDLFGAFYMNPIDRFFDDENITCARYVDDMYIFVDSIDSAERVIRGLVPQLRSYDLNLNEVKSKIILKSALFAEEPDLEELFSRAVEEVSSQLAEEETDEGYGFQEEWDDLDNGGNKGTDDTEK